MLQGIGGIGKSTLAFYLVNKLLNDYDDYKFKWFDFNTDLNVEYKSEFLKKNTIKIVKQVKIT